MPYGTHLSSKAFFDTPPVLDGELKKESWTVAYLF